MENIFSIGIIILLIFYIYGQNEVTSKKAKIKKIPKVDKTPKLDKKQKYIIKVINNLNKKTNQPNTIAQNVDAKQASKQASTQSDTATDSPKPKTMDLISAYTIGSDDNYISQHISTKPLQSIDSNEIKGRDFIKTNFVDVEKSSLVAGPAPAPDESSTAINDIIGITNAPMYAPVESIDKSVDIFLINQINTTKNNSVAYLDHPVITSNNKMNYIKNNSSFALFNPAKSVENVVGYNSLETKLSEI